MFVKFLLYSKYLNWFRFNIFICGLKLIMYSVIYHLSIFWFGLVHTYHFVLLVDYVQGSNVVYNLHLQISNNSEKLTRPTERGSKRTERVSEPARDLVFACFLTFCVWCAGVLPHWDILVARDL